MSNQPAGEALKPVLRYVTRADGSLYMAIGNAAKGYHEQFDFYGSEDLAKKIVEAFNRPLPQGERAVACMSPTDLAVLEAGGCVGVAPFGNWQQKPEDTVLLFTRPATRKEIEEAFYALPPTQEDGR